MNKQPIIPHLDRIPSEFHDYFIGAKAFDSSCSKEAQVIYLDSGLYLKSAPKGSLDREALMTDYFHHKGMGARVLKYVSAECDWLLTEEMCGDDCLYAGYLAEPERLCDTTAELLRTLHDTDASDCPVTLVQENIIAAADQNYRRGAFNEWIFSGCEGFDSAEQAWKEICRNGHLLTCDCLIHGDYCLPNIILNGWKLSGFIDVGAGGIGERHTDLFWGMWSLSYNLKTDRYRDRFLDAYGRDAVDENRLRLVGAIEALN